jgi:hypothetical protein
MQDELPNFIPSIDSIIVSAGVHQYNLHITSKAGIYDSATNEYAIRRGQTGTSNNLAIKAIWNFKLQIGIDDRPTSAWYHTGIRAE